MNPKTITVTHANHRAPMDLAVALIAGWYWSPGNQCLHVVAAGGAVFPALESMEEFRRLYSAATAVTKPATTAKEQ